MQGLNLFEMAQEWVATTYQITLDNGKTRAVTGDVWGCWGIHYDPDEKNNVLTYVPNGKAAKTFGWACTVAELKSLATAFDAHLINNEIPTEKKAMRRILADFLKGKKDSGEKPVE
jgi:hypothetical protein